MPTDRFVAALNEQIANELAASQQYIAIAVAYDAQTLPRLAAFFYQQSLEERNHAMMMVRYLLDVDARVEIPGVDAPQLEFVDCVAPVSLALEQERRVGDEIFNLMKVAREDGDYASEQFIQWFVKEQVEEVASMSSLHDVVERAKEQPLLAEDYLARESGDGAGRGDPTAPPVAGGAL
ncbi:MAG TPA: ferritin [Thermoleophilaceae bacterium]|nr:ferritin [Thermoleophilaceae bacterium]